MKGLIFSGLLVTMTSAAGIASAATLSFDNAANQGGGTFTEAGFTFDDIRIVSGNCPGDAPCGALNRNETSTLTADTGDFSLLSFAVELLGAPTVLTLTTNLGDMFDVVTDGVVNLASLGTFDNVSSITFTANLGNVRIDDLTFEDGNEPAPIPLPAGGLLLAGALGLVGLVRRRKAA